MRVVLDLRDDRGGGERVLRRWHGLPALSEQLLIDCCTRGVPGTSCGACAGGDVAQGLQWFVNRRGGQAVSAASYADTSDKTGTGAKCADPGASGNVAQIHSLRFFDQDEDEIAAYVATKGPVAVSVDAAVLQSYDAGVLQGASCNHHNTNHAVLLVGFGIESPFFPTVGYWVLKNSWGPSWGEGGFIRIRKGIYCIAVRKHAVAAIIDDSNPLQEVHQKVFTGTACSGAASSTKSFIVNTCEPWYDGVNYVGASNWVLSADKKTVTHKRYSYLKCEVLNGPSHSQYKLEYCYNCPSCGGKLQMSLFTPTLGAMPPPAPPGAVLTPKPPVVDAPASGYMKLQCSDAGCTACTGRGTVMPTTPPGECSNKVPVKPGYTYTNYYQRICNPATGLHVNVYSDAGCTAKVTAYSYSNAVGYCFSGTEYRTMYLCAGAGQSAEARPGSPAVAPLEEDREVPTREWALPAAPLALAAAAVAAVAAVAAIGRHRTAPGAVAKPAEYGTC